MNASIQIAGRDLGPVHPTFVIAEIGVNHDGSVERGTQNWSKKQPQRRQVQDAG